MPKKTKSAKGGAGKGKAKKRVMVDDTEIQSSCVVPTVEMEHSAHSSPTPTGTPPASPTTAPESQPSVPASSAARKKKKSALFTGEQEEDYYRLVEGQSDIIQQGFQRVQGRL